MATKKGGKFEDSKALLQEPLTISFKQQSTGSRERVVKTAQSQT